MRYRCSETETEEEKDMRGKDIKATATEEKGNKKRKKKV